MSRVPRASTGAQRTIQSFSSSASMLATKFREYPIAAKAPSLDLHVLSTPPAFVLSQNQTLRKKNFESNPCLLSPEKPSPAPRASRFYNLLLKLLNQARLTAPHRT